MVDYKLAVYNACRDNNLNGLMVSSKTRKFIFLSSFHSVHCHYDDVSQTILS